MTYHKVTEGVSGSGSVAEFDTDWKEMGRSAAQNYFTRGPVTKQIQLSFKSQWEIYRDVMQSHGITGGKSLEPGSGRGSISLYFADAGFDVTLLDTSADALALAKEIFSANGLTASYVTADALKMPFPDNTFDAVVHVGLLEHFEEYEACLKEQVRVLRPGGVILADIVPGKWSVQRLARPGIFIFKLVERLYSRITGRPPAKKKSKLYRTNYGSDVYGRALEKLGCTDIEHSGMFPVPVFSYSPDFPFSPNHPAVERVLVFFMKLILGIRRLIWPKRHPWLCSERWGQHILVTARKLVRA